MFRGRKEWHSSNGNGQSIKKLQKIQTGESYNEEIRKTMEI